MILIDADIIAYRASASCMPSKQRDWEEPEGIALARLDESMHRIMGTLEIDEYTAFITGTENFRYALYPEYKANRKDLIPPKWLNSCKEYLVSEWDTKITYQYEADDAIGIWKTKYPDAIIATIDKDLKQIPGKFFDFVKLELHDISENEANFNFWAQMLIGDRSDNIPGIYGIGPVKARNLLANVTPKEREEIVRDMYNDDVRFELNKKLFRILRSEEELRNIIESNFSQSKGDVSSEVS